jgi:anti-sigma-K factor RskA
MSAGGSGSGADGCGGNAAPYVLGALTEQEHEDFVRHMESCAICREEVAALELVAATLPAAAPQMRAPAELKQRVMSSVREDARRQRAQDAEERRAASVHDGARRPAALAWLRWRPNLAAAALAAAVVVLALVVLASGGGGATHVYHATVLPHGASASLSVSDGRAQLDIADMPQAASGHVYEMWLKRSAAGQPVPTDALFTVDADGAASVGVPGGVKGVREVMVTSEPLGGSRVPTLPALIVARLS